MRDRRAPGGARQAARPRERRCERYAEQPDPLDRIDQRADHHVDRKPDAERRQHRPAALDRECRGKRHDSKRDRRDEPLPCPEQVATLPGEQWPERNGDQQRHEQRAEGEIEERRTDRNLVAGQRFERERVERADEHGGAGGGEEQVVEDERALARDRREDAALFQRRRAPRIEREPAADEHAPECRE